MNNKICKIICLTSILFYSRITFSQTTTINYLTSDLSTTACNVFGPTSVSVNNIPHSSFAGGVKFNSTMVLYLEPQQVILLVEHLILLIIVLVQRIHMIYRSLHKGTLQST